MHRRSLILIVNVLALLAACATGQGSRQLGVDSPPAWDSSAPAAAGPPGAGARSSTGSYLPPVPLDLYRLLPPPPEAGSARERAELDEMLRIQAARTPAQAQRARADATVSVFRFADALGDPPAFNPQRLPRLAQLFQRIGRDEAAFMDSAKDAFGRPRPFRTESKLSPVVPKPSSASYPSGHATWAVASAIVLSDMVPERRAQIFSRADEYAHNREVGGVHYPSDIAAGHLAGTVFAQELFHSPSFLADENAAAAELRQALGLAPRQPATRH